MKAHIESTLTELRALAAPILACADEVEGLLALCESKQDIDSVTLDNERELIKLFIDIRTNISVMSNSRPVQDIPTTLSRLYSDSGSRANQVQTLGNELREKAKREAQKQAQVEAAARQQVEQQAAYDAQTLAMKQRLGIA